MDTIGNFTLSSQCSYIPHSLNRVFWSPNNVVLTLKCVFIVLSVIMSSTLSSVSELSNVCAFSALFILVWRDTLWRM